MNTAPVFVVLSALFGAYHCVDVIPSAAYFPEPLPGDFMGVPTAPADGCFVATSSITCSNISDTVFTDGTVGDETGSLVPTSFHAWSDSSETSGFSLSHGTATVRQVKLFFYHEPSMRIGLPQFILSATSSSVIAGNNPLDYTLLGNQDLSQDDATVRNVTLALTSTQTNEHFYIRFSLTDEIQQFVVSEVELCSDEATIEVEDLSLVLQSEPLAGPDILLPANTTQVPSTATLTCTVANQGRFQWQWTLQDSSSPSSVWVSDGTRSSAIDIPLGTDGVGNYTCTARYHSDSQLPPSPVTGIFTVRLERILTAVEETISIDGQSSVSLQCRLAGYVDLLSDDANIIQWRFNGQRVISGGDNLITVGRPNCEYGTCVTSLLIISNLDSSDLGKYTCSFESLTQTITLISEVAGSLSPTASSTATSTPTSTSTPSTPMTDPTAPSTSERSSSNSNNTGPIIGGVVGALLVAIIVIGIVIVVIVVCSKGGKGSASLSSPKRNIFDDDPDGLYSEVSKPAPPPLPRRTYTLPGNYATIDSGNGDIEMAKMTSPMRDSVISMPADMGHPTSMTPMHSTPPPEYPDLMPAKLSTKPNFLLSNPLYLSADNLTQSAPAPPQKRFGSNPCLTDSPTSSGLNIYAVPHKIAPPLPERLASPTLSETVPTPLYSEATLTPASFQDVSQVESPTGKIIAPYASIYADPKPLMKEEGPVEIRPYHIKEVRPLGTGQFGEVMLAETRGLSLKDLKLSDTNTDKSITIRVAVKRLKTDADKVVKEAFEKEIKFMARLNHMNVIRLLAICPSGNPFILMEYMEGGDLNQHLNKYEIAPPETTPAENQIPVATLLYMCVQISNGMRYLASLNFIHRDLATRNCLVGQNNTVKIADFGMSRSLYSSHYYRIRGRAMLPIRWMANECFYGRFSEKTDIWAFGVAMWEVFTLAKEQPYSSMSDQEVIENAVNTVNSKLLQKPEHCPAEVYDVMLQCWESDPDKRTNFEDVYASLAALHSYSDM